MENLLPVIRNAVRALIVRDDHILVLRKAGYADGERYALPGGGQDPGETLRQALLRECREEIGVQVEIQDLIHVADYFKARDTDPPSTRHLVEFLFRCKVPDSYIPVNGEHPDSHQVEVIWAPLDLLSGMPLFPRALATFLGRRLAEPPDVYMGVID
jgi:ADP-ribose pyrophosphatase YjhB (NUDIX family)